MAEKEPKTQLLSKNEGARLIKQSKNFDISVGGTLIGIVGVSFTVESLQRNDIPLALIAGIIGLIGITANVHIAEKADQLSAENEILQFRLDRSKNR